MTREEAVAAVLRVMDSLGINIPKPGKFVGDWRFVADAGMDSIDDIELILEIEDEHEVDLPVESDRMSTVGELADLLVKAKA